MKTVLVALSLVLAFGTCSYAELIYSNEEIYIATRKETPHIYDWNMGGETCSAMVMGGRLVNIACGSSGLKVMMYMSGNKVVVARKGSTKKYGKNKVAYEMFQTIIEHAKENGTVVYLE